MFSERLNLLIKDKNVKQSDLASNLGVSTSAVNKWCTTNREPEYSILTKIADYFEVTTDFLLGRELKSDSKKEQELIEKDALKNALINSGYMNDGEDITDKELENLMEMAKANKKFIKGLK